MSIVWHETEVNFKKLIRDLREQFPYDHLTALVIETFANSIDAEANKISINIKKNGILQILDNGKGMSESEFKDYHNIASMTKIKGRGIGFAGVGAKIFLDKADYTITESKSKKYHASSYWEFTSQKPKWKIIENKNKIKKTGTFVEVKIKNNEDIKRLTESYVTKILQVQYNAILLKLYNTKEIRLNGKIVKPWKPSNIEHEKILNFTYRRNNIKGVFIKSSSEIPDDFQGPQIVVHGKKIQQHWFKQYPIYPETFTGYILADYLISILTTSKAQFDYTSGTWRRFHSKMGKILSDWLSEINAKPKPPSISSELEELAREIQESINNVLKSPEFKELSNNLFQNIIRKVVGIQESTADLLGKQTDTMQMVGGTKGLKDEGGKVPTLGDEEGVGIIEDESGDTPIKRVIRRAKGGIRIGFDDKPDILKEAWIDPAQMVIIINREYPSFKVSYGMNAENYHILRCVFEVILEEIPLEMPEHTIAALYTKWFQFQSG